MTESCPRCQGHVFPPEWDPAGFWWLVCSNGHRRTKENEDELRRSYTKGRPIEELSVNDYDMVAPKAPVDPALLERVRAICRERNAAAKATKTGLLDLVAGAMAKQILRTAVGEK